VRLASVIAVALLAGSAAGQTISVVSSPHDLSASSTADIRASTESEICVFCHTPHNASPVAALWNRSLSPQAYSIYTSRALDAHPGQPTGSSKLCLSCHDGTIALGSVLSRSTPIQMQGGVTTMPLGHGNLGTDLRDDHPISFQYDGALAARDQRLRSPGAIDPALKLDSNRELQCTTCHEPHNNAFGSFLVMRNTASELCVSCHQMGTTDISGHAQCTDCHQSHSAPSGPYLLRAATTTLTCIRCHDGSDKFATNIAIELHEIANHDNNPQVDPSLAPNKVMDCASCHEPHTMMRGVGATPAQTTGPRRTAFGRLGRVSGVNSAGSPVQPANEEHEVCFKCHADQNPVVATLPRRQQQSNMQWQFNGSAISSHAVGQPGRAMDVPSLRPGWTTASTMECSDCHGPNSGLTAGVHGSSNPGLLVARLSTQDYSSESESNYALCYRCHDRTNILSNASFSEHNRHIVQARTPCTVCHDSHGIALSSGSISGNAHLVNFQTDVVFPDQATGRLEYRTTGARSGECFLNCHNQNHSGTRYPVP